MQAGDLTWVSEDGGKDDTTRRLIRVQAMKQAAAARRATGTWGKLNMRQPPPARWSSELRAHAAKGGELSPALQQVDAAAADGPAARQADRTMRRHYTKEQQLALVLKGRRYAGPYLSPEACLSDPGPPVPASGVEKLLIDTGFNILDLNELTLLHIGQAAGTLINKQPRVLNTLMSRRSRSFLSEVPSRYGHTACLDDAIRCVALRVHRFLVPNRTTSMRSEVALYGRALQGLQGAVDDKDRSLNPDVLCTIQLLGLYEMFDFPSRSQAWELHVRGAIQLIRHRGPDQFHTEFEKDLLVSMISPFVDESLRARTPCFLEDVAWQRALMSCVRRDARFTPRSYLYLSLSCIGSTLPRLFISVTMAVIRPNAISEEELDKISSELSDTEIAVRGWMKDYEKLAATSAQDGESAAERDYKAQQGTAAMGLMAVMCRLQGAITADRAAPEGRCIAYMDQLKKHLERSQPLSPWAIFYMGQSMLMPEAIMDTTGAWLSPSETPTRIIEAWKYLAWTGGIRAAKFRSWSDAMNVK